MNAKAYLSEIRKLDKKIDNKQMELDSLRSLVESITSRIKEVNVQTNGSKDIIGESIIKIIDLTNETNRDIDKYVDMKLEAIRLINRMENDELANILLRRYINYESWEKIAEDLNYTRQAINKKHGVALLEFEKCLHELT